MKDFFPRRTDSAAGPIIVLWAIGLVGAFAGCRSDAHTDLYVDEMAAEIRVLEDQLYQADHENRILRERLGRAEGQTGATSAPSRLTPSSTTAPRGSTAQERDASGSSRSSSPRSNPKTTPPRTQSPTPADPPPIVPQSPKSDGPRIPPTVGPLDGGPVDAPPERPPARLGVPPQEPNKDIIPGTADPPKIDLGQRVAPPTMAEPPGDAADKVKLPGAVQRLLDEPAGPPEEIRLDPAQTRPFSDAEGHGIDVVLMAFDSDGRPTDIAGELEIAAMDPAGSGATARLGRWAVTTEQVQRATRDRIVRLHLYWPDSAPTIREAKLFIRIRREGDTGPNTQQLVQLQPAGGASDWLPRTAQGDASGTKTK